MKQPIRTLLFSSLYPSCARPVHGIFVETRLRSIYAGVPAKKVKDISQELIHGEIDRIANNYIRYADWFRNKV